ncbi:MAG TPA: NAD(P)-dependent oxidoreductase, partial [Cytophagales bacterium]|nr:NAD(P)-dependent oxidoreductase [Cytophagales bacterium]
MNIVFLDADTMGSDVSLAPIAALGTFMPYAHTKPEEVVMRALEAQVIITNKVVLDEQILAQLPALKLICVAATGTNNIDLEYAKRHGILVNNAIDYSTKSVAQHTFTMLFALISNIMWYDPYVKGGAYAQSPHFTNLDRPYFEISGKRWGIIGMGNIGRCVAGIATAFGCKVNYASVSGAVRQEVYEA